LATSLKKNGFHDVTVLDGQKDQQSKAQFASYVRQASPDLIGIQVFSSCFTVTQRALRILRDILPDAILVIGGPHVTATAERALEDLPEADFGFAGEAEPGFPLLVNAVLNQRSTDLAAIPGLIYRKNGKHVTNPRAVVKDLDGLGFPSWECIPPNTYPDSPQGAFYKRYPIAPILTTRGCPYECTYCGSPVNMTRQYRERSIEHVLDEIELLSVEYGVREIHIIDDLFSLKKSRVLDFCHGLNERGLDIAYTFPNGLRLDSLDRDMLLAMKATGAYAFTVGIESGSDRTLKAMKKQLSLSIIREKLQLICDCGLEPSGFFIIGFPGETKDDIEQTIQFAKSLPLKRAHFSNYLPLPGTESTLKLYQEGAVIPGNWSELAYYKTPYVPEGLTKRELKRLQRMAFLSFHLRPRILMKLLMEIRSFNHLKSIFVRAWNYLFRKGEQDDNFLT